jgi:hypothetical protein
VRTTTRQQATRQPLVRFPILVGLVLVSALGAAACSATSATRTSPDQPGSRGQGRLVDIGRRAKPVVTPDDPDAFRAALAAAGLRVPSRAPGGARRP